jgi:predicted nucleic acid-binding protein
MIDLEVLSAWRRLLAQGRMTAGNVEQAVVDLNQMPIRRISHRRLIHRCWELRDILSSYAAAYVALAELFDVPLLTTDAALARAPGSNCQVELLE